jgi:rare lipoprotein A
MHAMTAAHKTWPMDTMVRVENLKNGKSVVVRINDRGPFVSGRVIDCSYAAGKQIGLDTLGIAPVRLTVLGFAGKVYRPPVQTQNTVVATKPVPTVKLSNFGIQVGAFSRHEGAISYRDKYQKIAGANLHVVIKNAIEGRDSLYRVRIMGFSSEDEARDFMSSNGIQGGIIVRP